MKVQFFLKDSTKSKSAINAIFHFRGQRYKMATGVSIVPMYWNNTDKRAKNKKEYPDSETINIMLDRFERKLSEKLEEFQLKNEIPTAKELREMFSAGKKKVNNTSEDKQNDELLFLPYFYKYYTENYTGHTLSKYQTTYNWLVKYEKKYRLKLSFNDINLDFYNHFRKWFLQSTYIPRAGAEPVHFSINYFGSLIKCIQKVMNATGPRSRVKLHSNEDINHPDFKVEHETSDSIYLSVEELTKIHHFVPDIYNISPIMSDLRVKNRLRKVESLKVAKNKFLIGAFSALRVSDFNRLSEVNIKENFIRIKPQKGTKKNEDVVIPIHSIIREILESGFDIKTKLSDQNINQHIKEVCQLIGLNELVSVSRTEGFQVVERTYKKYELVTSHTARRSGATNMYLAGIPSISIMKITGHKTEKSFLKYIKISQEENAILLSSHSFFR